MLSNTNNIIGRRTLLNQMRVRGDFYNEERRAGERMLSYINMIKKLGSMLKSMDTTVGNQEIAMVMLCVLLSTYNSIVTTLDALSGEHTIFAVDVVESGILQEEQ